MFYSTLEVSKKATDEEIRTAYRQLALKYHPDKNNGETLEKFQEVQKAYEVLGEKEKRAEYDGAVSKSKSRMKGFVRPDPITGFVKKPFTYKLADSKMYVFESATDRVKCRLQSGDLIAFNTGPTKTNGVFIGIASDDFLYWCKDGTDYAQRLCHCGSDMGLASITIVQRANLEPHRVHLPASSTPRGGAKKSPRSGQSAKELYATLRRKEEAKLTSVRLQRIEPDEAEERAEMEHESLTALDNLYAHITVTLRALEKKLPLEKNIWQFMGYDTPPKVSARSSHGRDKEVRLSPSSALPPGLHEFSSPQASIVADGEHCRTPPPFSPNASFLQPAGPAARQTTAPPAATRLPLEGDKPAAEALYQAFTQRMQQLQHHDDDDADGSTLDDSDGADGSNFANKTFDTLDVDAHSNGAGSSPHASTVSHEGSDEEEEDEGGVAYQIASERLPKGSSPGATAAAAQKTASCVPTSEGRQTTTTPSGPLRPAAPVVRATSAKRTPAPDAAPHASSGGPQAAAVVPPLNGATAAAAVFGASTPPPCPEDAAEAAAPVPCSSPPPATDPNKPTPQHHRSASRTAAAAAPAPPAPPRAVTTPRVNPPAPPVGRVRTSTSASPSQGHSGLSPLMSDSPQAPGRRPSGHDSPAPLEPMSSSGGDGPPCDTAAGVSGSQHPQAPSRSAADSLPTSGRGPGPVAGTGGHPHPGHCSPLPQVSQQISLSSPEHALVTDQRSATLATCSSTSPIALILTGVAARISLPDNGLLSSSPGGAGVSTSQHEPLLRSPLPEHGGTDAALMTPDSAASGAPAVAPTNMSGVPGLSSTPTDGADVRKSQSRKTPRYMDATRSMLKRVQSVQIEGAGDVVSSPMVEGLGSGTSSPRVKNANLATTYSRAKYDSFTADELFAQEEEFMKTFGQKKTKKKRR